MDHPLVSTDPTASTQATQKDPTWSPHSRSTKRKYTVATNEDDELPLKMHYVKVSERCVRDDVYTTIAELKGSGLSTQESLNAIA